MRRILPVVGVVVLVLVLGFVVLGSCSGSSQADKYRSYVQDVNSVARQSNTDAKTLDAALYNQELTPDQVTARVASLIPRRERRRDDGRRAQAGRRRSRSRTCSATCCRRCSTARWRCRSSRPRSRGRWPARPTRRDRGAARCGGQRLQRADRLRRRLRGELPAPVPGDPEARRTSPTPPSSRRSGRSRPSSRTRMPTATASGSSPCATPARPRPAADGAIGTSIDGVTANGKALDARHARSRP